jgi:hypothetical protein
MPRTLSMQERRVSDAERADYLAALSARSSSASAAQAHFWVFEHARESGRFLEFTEAADAVTLAQLLGVEDVSDHWREVRGG